MANVIPARLRKEVLARDGIRVFVTFTKEVGEFIAPPEGVEKVINFFRDGGDVASTVALMKVVSV